MWLAVPSEYRSACCGSSTVASPLCEDANQLAAGNGLVYEADRTFARHRERHERVRKKNGVAKGKDRELVGKIERPIGGELLDLEGFVAVTHGESRPRRGCAARPLMGTG
jgi:hypothetical protein